MRRSMMSGFLALALVAIGGDALGQAQTHDLAAGKHRVSAAFPCTPARERRLAGKVDPGGEIFITSLICAQGDHTYSLGVMEYPPALMRAHSVDDLLESYGQNAGAKKHVKIKSSQRLNHKGFPAMSYHVLDTPAPAKELIIMSVLVDTTMLTLHVHARSGAFQAGKHAAFADSLNIAAQK